MSRTAIVFLLAAVMGVAVLAQEKPVRQTIEGQGDTVTDPIELRQGLLLVGAGHKGDRLFAVQLLNAADGKSAALFVNQIGVYKSARIQPVKAGKYVFQVTAKAPWVLMFEQPSISGKGEALPTSHEATGDLVLGPLELKPGLLKATLTHAGARHFGVTLYGADGSRAGLLANAIGKYEGSSAHAIRTAGLYYVDIGADGPWTIKLQ